MNPPEAQVVRALKRHLVDEGLDGVIRYLDTNIMAQPHTYFISKLPRLSDRQAVAEAFGVSEELLNQTFKFKKGHWLLISHDATGLEAVPVPIAAPNANDRIADWLNGRYPGK